MTLKTTVSRVTVMQWKLVTILACCLFFVALGAGVGGADAGAPECADVEFEQNEDGYYEVGTLEELQCIEDNGLEHDYVLVNDIDASETEDWNGGDGFEPIGDYDNNADVEFRGTFDGANHTIEGLFIDRPDEDWVGLFARVEGAGTAIENVGLVDADVTGNQYVGTLAGATSDATITDSYATGNATSDLADVGGLVGKNTDATIVNSHATVTVSGDAWRAGGLVGRNEGTVSNSYATGNVTGEIQVGGLAGRSDDELSESYATGTVTASDRQVGGLVGWIRDGSSISDSYATGDVTGGDSDAGGLVGRSSSSSISGSYATGTVTGDSEVGGLLGQNSDFGEGDGRVSQSYATGNVTGQTNVGGLVGSNQESVEDSYWDDEAATVIEDGEEVEGQSDGGTPLSTSEMTGANAPGNMTAFEFPDGDGDWHATDEYPALAWQDTGPLFGVNVTETNSPVSEGDVVAVTTAVTNWGADGEQTVELLDAEGGEADTEDVALESGDADEVTLEWETEVTDAGTGDVTVTSENEADSQAVVIRIHPTLEDCRAIDQPGTYELGADIDASGMCIEITADDVTLDGNEYTIDGGDTGILVSGASNVTITNVTVTDSATDGIVLAAVDGATVESNTVADSGRYGIFLEDSTDVVVSDNDLVDNGDGEYRELYPREDEVDGPADSGIALWGTTHSTVEANTMTGNNRFGISAVQSSHNEYLDNVVEVDGNNRGGGIHLGAGSSENTISGSTITVTSGTVSVDWESNLIYVVTGENNVVTDNELDGERTRGIFIHLSSNAVVENNTIAGLYGHGVEIDQRDVLADPLLGLYAANPGPATVANNSLEDVAVETKEFSSSDVGASGLYLHSNHAVETRNNTGTESGPDVGIRLSEQFVENQSITTSAGETTMSFEGEGLVLDGLEEPPNAERPDGLAPTGYYVEIEDFVFENDRFDEFTGTYDARLENLELAYNETLLTTGDTVDPETLSLWRLDGGEWEELEDAAVDTDEQVVTRDVMESGTIGVFGEEPPLVDLDVEDVTIDQGEPLAVDLDNATDSIGDPFDGESDVVFGVAALEGFDEPVERTVTFEDGEATDVELLTASQTTALSAETTTVAVDTEGQDEAAAFDVTVEAVLADFGVADDVAIEQGEPLAVDLENAEDEAGDTFTGTVDLAGASLDGQALSADDVEFDDAGAVADVRLLEPEETEELSAGDYADVSIDAVDTDATAAFDVTVEAVLADFDVTASDDPVDQGEPLEVDVTNAEDEAGDPFSDTVDLTVDDIDGVDADTTAVEFTDGSATGVELFDGETPMLTADAYDGISVSAQEASDEFDVTVAAVLADFDVADDATIEQGEPLEVDLENAVDRAGDDFEGSADLSGDDVDAQPLSVEDVAFADGEASDVELFTAEDTASISAATYEAVTLEGGDGSDTFEVAVDAVLGTLDVEDATISRGDPLDLTVTGAFDLAGDPFEGELETTVGMDALETVDDQTRTVSFAGEDDVVLETVLDGETTADVDADTYALEVSAGSATEAVELVVEHLEVAVAETTSPVVEGDSLAVTATVTNPGSEPAGDTVTLTDTGFDGVEQDAVAVDLEPGASTTVVLEWETDGDDVGSGDVTVSTGTDDATVTVTVDPDPVIDEERRIEHPGEYVVAEDFTATETAVEVAADGVTIDGAGREIAVESTGQPGILVDDAEDVTITDLTLVHEDGDAIEIGDGAGVSVDALTVDAPDANATTLSFTGVNVSVGASPSPGAPDGLESLGRYFEATPDGDGELIDLELAYDDLGTVDPDTVSLWKFDDDWSEFENSSVDTAAGVVTANVTAFSTFGAFGQHAPTPPGSPGSSDPARFVLGDVDLDPTVDVDDGRLDAVTVDVDDGRLDAVTVDVENVGSQTGEETLELSVAGETRASEIVHLGGGEDRTVEFTDVNVSDLEPGEYAVNVTIGDDDRLDGTLTVVGGVELLEYDIVPSKIVAGDGIDRVTVQVSTTDDLAHTTDVVFRVGAEVVATERDVDLEGDDPETITLTDVDLGHLDPGAYEYSIHTDDDVTRGTLSVQAPDDRTVVVEAVAGTQPIVDATVEVDGTTASTDDAGVAQVDGLEAGEHVVTVTADGYADETVTVDLEEGDETVTVDLEESDDGAADDGATDDGATDDAVPGFDVLLALLAIAVLIVVGGRRTVRER